MPTITDSPVFIPSIAAKTAIDETKAVDVTVLQALIGDDEIVVTQFLHDYRVSAIEIGWALCKASEHGTAMETASHAHKLKSASRTVGALALGIICESLEFAGKAGEPEALYILLPIFKQELARVEAFLLDYQMLS